MRTSSPSIATAAAFEGSGNSTIDAAVYSPASAWPINARQAEVVEADYWPHGVAIIEFPSLEQVLAWYDSAEYQNLKALRQRSARGTVLFLDGFPGP